MESEQSGAQGPQAEGPQAEGPQVEGPQVEELDTYYSSLFLING